MPTGILKPPYVQLGWLISFIILIGELKTEYLSFLSQGPPISRPARAQLSERRLIPFGKSIPRPSTSKGPSINEISD